MMMENRDQLDEQDQEGRPSVEIRSEDLIRAIQKGVAFFRENQRPDGEWVAELEGDALLQSETIILLAFLGEEDSEWARGCSKRLLETVLPGGGWEMYPGAGADVTNSVKGYFALKLTGHDPASEVMVRTRETILRLGGAEKVNSFTRFYLAILGQIPYDQTPAVPPQMILLPRWFPINIYAMSSWSRTIFVPLSIVSALQPVRKLPANKGIRELMTRDPKRWPPIQCPGRKISKNPFSWDSFFRRVDRLIWRFRRWRFTPFRKKAIDKAIRWTLDHFKESDAPGAIYPPIIWAWVALKALGYSDDSPEILRCRHELGQLLLRDENSDSIRFAPYKSPVWDTSLSNKALRLARVSPDDPMIKRAEKWLLAKQARLPGDWSQKVSVPPGGWPFEYNNPFYPDNDDTAMALMVLSGQFPEGEINAKEFSTSTPDISPSDPQAVPSSTTAEEEQRTRQVEAGWTWLRATQNKDGGWAAFDKGNTLEILCRVPFADHNAMIDPSTPDLTGRVLEAFGRHGGDIRRLNRDRGPLRRCLAFMKSRQEADGSWFGRWGINYIYGTWQALTGLTSIGVDPKEEMIQAGANWLLTCQQASGAWGESADSYRDPSLKGKGNPTASQTAWGVMGLIAAGLTDHPATARGIHYLIKTQGENGRWEENDFTGTGFPQVFYLKYHYYPAYFPLMALSIYAAKRFSNQGGTVSEVGKDAPSEDSPEETPAILPKFSPETTSTNLSEMSPIQEKRGSFLRLFRGEGSETSDEGMILPFRTTPEIPFSGSKSFRFRQKASRGFQDSAIAHPIPPEAKREVSFPPPLTLYVPEEEETTDYPEGMVFRFESYL